MTSLRRYLLQSLLLLLFWVPQFVHAAFEPNCSATNQAIEHTTRDRFDYYNRAYADILFIHLNPACAWAGDYDAFTQALGPDATNMDYAHPPAVRKDLLDLSLARVRWMLDHREPSASLFKRAGHNGSTKSLICTITLEADDFARNDRVATESMLDLDARLLSRVAPRHYLDFLDQIRFTIDHEAYHCLDAVRNGPMPMSQLEHYDHYYAFRNENGADAYAAMMHARNYGRVTGFIENMQRIRALTILNNDLQHYTVAALEHVLATPLNELMVPLDSGIVALATRIEDEVMPSYDQFIALRDSVHRELRMLFEHEATAAVAGTPLTTDGSAGRQAVEQAQTHLRELLVDSAAVGS